MTHCVRFAQLHFSFVSPAGCSLLSFSRSFFLPARPGSRPLSVRRVGSARLHLGPARLVSSMSVVVRERAGVFAAPRDGRLLGLSAGAGADFAGDLLVVGVWEPEEDKGAGAAPGPGLPEELRQTLREIVEEEDFKAKKGSSTVMVRVGGKVSRVLVYGLGKKGNGLKALRGFVGFGVGKAKALKKCERLGLFLEDWDELGAQTAAESCLIECYKDKRFKGSPKNGKKDAEENEDDNSDLKLKQVVFLHGNTRAGFSFDEQIARARAVAAGILTTKELVAAPANVVTPTSLAECATMVAKEEGLEIKILEQSECEKLGMWSYLAVNQGSSTPPKFIHMTYKPSQTPKKKIAIVGKSVCHDTGGYNLKTGAGSWISLMKIDMGGGATAIGAAKAIGALKPKDVEVHFIMPACENMISGTAVHPGDIVTASNGKTIEIVNTDAEGRLTLADAIVYAENLGNVDYIVDIATLTGGVLIALGTDIAGMWSSDDTLANALEASSKKVGDPMWRLPLPGDYVEMIKSKIADLKNSGGRTASSITAALFLKQFIHKVPWAHLDIAGVAWSEKTSSASGWGVRTFVDWVETLSKS